MGSRLSIGICRLTVPAIRPVVSDSESSLFTPAILLLDLAVLCVKLGTINQNDFMQGDA